MATIRGKNEGSIFRQSNGKWRAQVSIEGKRISHTADRKLNAKFGLGVCSTRLIEG